MKVMKWEQKQFKEHVPGVCDELIPAGETAMGLHLPGTEWRTDRVAGASCRLQNICQLCQEAAFFPLSSSKGFQRHITYIDMYVFLEGTQSYGLNSFKYAHIL